MRIIEGIAEGLVAVLLIAFATVVIYFPLIFIGWIIWVVAK